MKFKTLFTLILCFNIQASIAIEKVVDPLDSPSWEVMHQSMLNNEPVVFDDNIVVRTPAFAEDPMNVPISVSINGLEDIEEIVVFADLNPIQEVLSFKPIKVEPYLSFRIKVQQATPVRAAAKTKDGTWHVGGKWLDASGGGCTAPSVGRVAGNWYENLMDVSSRVWVSEERDRLRFRIMHPMDTGLAEGIPEFYIEHFDVTDQSGMVLAKLKTYQPVSENPVFTLNMPKGTAMPINLLGMDNNGNRLEASINK